MAAASESIIKQGPIVYPGVYAYKADRRISSSCPQGVDQPPIKVRRFDDGTEFFGLKNEVLVPRLGTHILMRNVAQQLLAQMGKEGHFTAVDVGTGSGIGAFYMAEAVSDNLNATVVATDINQHALDFAFMNFQNNRVKRAPVLMKTDLLTGVGESYGKVDFIFSNPPFAPTVDIPRNGFDPEHAYDGGPDGMDFYRRIAQQAKDILTPDGVLLFQISPTAPIEEMVRIAKINFPTHAVGLIGATEGPLKGKGPIGVLIGHRQVVEPYANRGIL